MKARSVLAAFALAGLVVVQACEGEASPPRSCDKQGCPKACTELREGGDCDVLDPSCQERIFEAVRCVRGAGSHLPELRTLSEEEERAEREPDVQMDAAIALSDDGGTDRSTSDFEAAPASITPAQRWSLAHSLFGLRALESTSDDVGDVAGYYDGADQRITLIDRGGAQDSESAQKTLAHELVHASQDQQVGLWEFRRNTGTTLDARLSVGCLVEGEANLYEELAWGLLRGLPVDSGYWRKSFARELKWARDQSATAESPLDKLWLLRYGVGAQYLSELWLEGGNRAVQALYEAPPISTAHWMHGLKASRTRQEPLIRSLSCDFADPPEGFKRAGADTMGAFVLYAFLGHSLAQDGIYPTAESWQRALMWQQDRFEIFAGPGDETAVSWRFRLANAKLAQVLERELSRALPGLKILVDDDELELLASDQGDLLDSWQGSLSRACSSAAP